MPGFDTGAGANLNVSLKGLEPGSWKLTLDWQHADCNYQDVHVFEIQPSPGELYKTSKYAAASLFHTRHSLYTRKC
ncbi:hypothetical protein [Pedobacter sp. SYP-B3415]|uniref:hypothetical protein n=1 Tax=Pedobacter sp. SYP-B3415 TaxID=2496641 RepID=UPI00101CDB7A|nr:hypothetical protein [Pedobacter sp. SYP-B3415]